MQYPVAPGGSALRATTGVIHDGPLIRALRAHRGEFVVTRQAVAGFIDGQGVRIADATDAGFRGVEVAVDGLQPGEDDVEAVVRRVVPVAALAIPARWLESAPPPP